MLGLKSLKTIMAAGVLALMAGGAGATTVTFERITSNSTIDASSQLSLTVTDDAANGRALFEFTVLTGLQNTLSVAEIYFSDILSVFTPPPSILFQSAGVSFEAGGTNNPPNVPGANGATPPFVTTAGLVAEAAGNNATGITLDEILRLGLNYASGKAFDDFLSAFADNEFRVALHVRSLAGGESDAFVSVAPVPLPAAGFLMLGALGGLAVMRRRRKAG